MHTCARVPKASGMIVCGDERAHLRVFSWNDAARRPSTMSAARSHLRALRCPMMVACVPYAVTCPWVPPCLEVRDAPVSTLDASDVAPWHARVRPEEPQPGRQREAAGGPGSQCVLPMESARGSFRAVFRRGGTRAPARSVVVMFAPCAVGRGGRKERCANVTPTPSHETPHPPCDAC